MKQHQKIRRSVRLAFLQSACGVLFAWIAGMTAGFLPQEAVWKIVLFALISSAAAAGLSALIQLVSGDA
jgi:hypothetical protein